MPSWVGVGVQPGFAGQQRQKTLQDVAGQRQDAGQLAGDPVDVGRTDVAAALVTHIFIAHDLGQDDAGWNSGDQVDNDQYENKEQSIHK